MVLSAIIVSLLLALLLLRVPIFASLILATLVPFACVEGEQALNLVADVFYGRINNYLFVAIPAFVLMAQLLLRTNAITDLYDALYALVRRIPGSLGIATILSCTVFSAISGSSIATTLTVGGVAIPQMNRFRYPRSLTFGIVASGGTLGILIPPSLGLIIYGVIADVSIGALFLAAIVPAVLLVTLFSLYALARSWRLPRDPAGGGTAGAGKKGSSRSLATLTLPVLIIGGIYGGVFTATEAAVVSAAWAALIAAVLYRSRSLAFFLGAARESAETTAVLFFIAGGAAYFSQVLVYLNIPGTLLDWVLALQLGEVLLFAALLCGVLLLGMFMDGLSVTLISTPIMIPILKAFGFDLVWYGIVLVIALEMSLLTPPVGINLYAIKSLSDATFGEVMKAVLPFLALMLGALVLIIAYPQLALWLPSQVYQ